MKTTRSRAVKQFDSISKQIPLSLMELKCILEDKCEFKCSVELEQIVFVA